MGQHAKFIARTVFVQNNNVEEACRVINKYAPSLIFYINHIFICFSTIYEYPTILIFSFQIIGSWVLKAGLISIAGLGVMRNPLWYVHVNDNLLQ